MKRIGMGMLLMLGAMILSGPGPLFAEGTPVQNGAFKNGLTGWEAFGKAKVFRAMEEGGNTWVRYEKQAADPADNYHLDQVVPFPGGKKVTLRFRYRTTGDFQPVVVIATSNFLQGQTEALPASPEWRDHAFVFYTEEGGPLRLQFFPGARGRSRQAFDGVSDLSDIRVETEDLSLSKGVPVSLDGMIRTLPKRLTGVNTLFWLETPNDLADGQIAGLLRDAKVGYLRFPGGTAGQNYDWEGKRVLDTARYPGPPKAGEAYLDSEGFIRLVGDAGSGSFVVLDFASIFLRGQKPGEPEIKALVEKAGRWAVFFKERNFTPTCWELGNEHYIPDKGAPHVQLRVRTYADFCRRFIAAIRAVDPRASFGVCGPEHGGFEQMGHQDKEDKTGDAWWPTLLSEVGGDVERIILHHYWGKMDQNPGRLNFGEDFTQWRDAYRAWSIQTGKPPRPFQVGYTEWGGPDYQDPNGYALFMHEAMGGFALAGADFLIEWPLRRFGDRWKNSLILDGKTPTAAYGVLHAWGNAAAGGDLLKVSELPTFISLTAVRQGEAIHLLIGNKSKSLKFPLEVGPKGMSRGVVRQGAMGAPLGAEKTWTGKVPVTVEPRGLVRVEIHPSK